MVAPKPTWTILCFTLAFGDIVDAGTAAERAPELTAAGESLNTGALGSADREHEPSDMVPRT